MRVEIELKGFTPSPTSIVASAALIMMILAAHSAEPVLELVRSVLRMANSVFDQLEIARQKEAEYLTFKAEIKDALEHLQSLRLAMHEARDEYTRQRLIASPQPGQDSLPIPKPMVIKSAIRKVKKVCAEILAIASPVAAISVKDPRTVAKYRALIPELRETLTDIQWIQKQLSFLERGKDA